MTKLLNQHRNGITVSLIGDRHSQRSPGPVCACPAVRLRFAGIMIPEAARVATLTSPVSISLENEKNPWLAAAARFDEAAQRLNLDDGMRKILRTPAREITVHIPVQLD